MVLSWKTQNLVYYKNDSPSREQSIDFCSSRQFQELLCFDMILPKSVKSSRWKVMKSVTNVSSSDIVEDISRRRPKASLNDTTPWCILTLRGKTSTKALIDRKRLADLETNFEFDQKVSFLITNVMFDYCVIYRHWASMPHCVKYNAFQNNAVKQHLIDNKSLKQENCKIYKEGSKMIWRTISNLLSKNF